MSALLNKVEKGVYKIDIPHIERQVFVCKDREDAFKYAKCDFCEQQSTIVATTIFNTREDCLISLWFSLKNPPASTVAHECLHAVNVIHDYVGIKADRNNDEADAYMLSYLVDSVYKALRKIAKEDGCK